MMATAHVYPFDTVKPGRGYDSDPYYRSPVTALGAVTTDTRVPPCVGHAAYSPDYESERPGDYLEDRQPTSASRYPPPAEADLVTLWKKDRRVVMSITAGGQTQDFYMPPGRLAYLIKEIAEQLAESTILQ